LRLFYPIKGAGRVKRSGKAVLRLALTAALLACLAVRVARLGAHWESVRHYYFPEGNSLFWLLAGFLLFALPLLLPVAAGVCLWREGRPAARLGRWSAILSGLCTLWEGLTLFARSMNANYGYVGAEPGLSAGVCLCAVAGLLLFHRGDLDAYL